MSGTSPARILLSTDADRVGRFQMKEWKTLSDIVDAAVTQIAAGQPVILVDSQDRENEGDLVLAAQFIDTERAATMIRSGGLFLLAAEAVLFERLQLPLIEPRHADADTPRMGVAFDARHGITTGISARDRTRTVQCAIDMTSGPDDIVLPGHIFPLSEHPDGLAGRQGHTEGAVALMRLAELFPAAVMSEVLRPDGDVARRDELDVLSREQGWPIIDIPSLVTASLDR
jgi:3,4-dihydroxy-2-butanone 4-phosphate synthase